MSFIK